MSSTESTAPTNTEGYHVRAGQGSDDPRRNAALQRAMTAARELGLTSISLNSAVAKHLDIHPTDAWILTYMRGLPRETSLTPGDLARVTGLTTGAITGVVDRLESQGYVRRERGAQDRRKVIIVPTEKSVGVAEVFHPLVEGIMTMALRYSTDELETISAYFEGATTATQDAITRLRRL
ncbi:MarR family winged helix-turn-helix transcriptional regulator [Streptomyces kebangsaanensis]|uniref:MarR family winged helix-turn-helix transcriptional regulator n=1 Tax=Streptomyces kebangsaanensis TaxID=864058 RepID=UPI001301502B|nr:MarR family transcriptional regulator [Streptomyces kebangsaanensis]